MKRGFATEISGDSLDLGIAARGRSHRPVEPFSSAAVASC
jgi:hypothetical protein